jgi:hypothetical protein
VEDGFYWKYLHRWARRFGPNELQVFLFEDLKADPRKFMTKVCDFLELSIDPYKDFHFRPKNVSLQVRSRWLHYTLHSPVKRLLPRGAFRDFTGGIYNRLNRHRRSHEAAKDSETVAALQRLDALYLEDSRLLAEQFRLDISAWENSSTA